VSHVRRQTFLLPDLAPTPAAGQTQWFRSLSHLHLSAEQDQNPFVFGGGGLASGDRPRASRHDDFSNETAGARFLLYVVGKDAPIIPLPLPLPSSQAALPALRRAASDLGARSDDELMTLAAAGVLDAFSALVGRHEGALRRFCAKLLGAGDVGDDVAQEVFLEIWRTCGRYDGRGRFGAFLFTTARDRCLNEIRARPVPPSDNARPVALADANAPVSRAQHYNSGLAYFDKPEMTPLPQVRGDVTGPRSVVDDH
jgi:hypothetical protein